MVRLKIANDLGTPLPTQVLAVKLLGFHKTARMLRRAELSAKRDLVAGLVRANLPDWEFELPAGGLFLWIRLPGGDSAELAQVAMRHRLVLLPGSNMSAEQRHGDMLRLPFLLEEDELQEEVAAHSGGRLRGKSMAERHAAAITRRADVNLTCPTSEVELAADL